MAKLIKILLLLIAVFPLWLTIVAMAEPAAPSDAWKDRINQELLELDGKRVQVVELLPTDDKLNEAWLKNKIQLDLSRVKPGVPSSFGLKILDEEGRLTFYTNLPARLLVQWKIPVSRREMKRGDQLDASSFEWKWVDASSLRRGVIRNTNIVGSEVRSYISAGSPIYARQIQAHGAVKRGDRVKVHVRGQGINISTYGVAQEAGRQGETIRILNTDSKKEIYAVITGKDEAEVNL